MTETADLKKMTMDELHISLQKLQSKLSILRRMPQPSPEAVDVMEYLQWELQNEISERYAISMTPKQKTNKNLTDDDLGRKEQKEIDDIDRENARPRPRPKF